MIASSPSRVAVTTTALPSAYLRALSSRLSSARESSGSSASTASVRSTRTSLGRVGASAEPAPPGEIATAVRFDDRGELLQRPGDRARERVHQREGDDESAEQEERGADRRPPHRSLRQRKSHHQDGSSARRRGYDAARRPDGTS